MHFSALQSTHNIAFLVIFFAYMRACTGWSLVPTWAWWWLCVCADGTPPNSAVLRLLAGPWMQRQNNVFESDLTEEPCILKCLISCDGTNAASMQCREVLRSHREHRFQFCSVLLGSNCLPFPLLGFCCCFCCFTALFVSSQLAWEPMWVINKTSRI